MAAINVRAEVPVKPFPVGSSAAQTGPGCGKGETRGAKEAAIPFEDGTVAAWYKDNGWTYPVQGPSASGLAAVQNFSRCSA